MVNYRRQPGLRTALALFALVIAAVATAVGSARAAPGALAACGSVGAPRVLVDQPGSVFEAAAFDRRGRLLLSDWVGNRLDVVDRSGARPRLLSPVDSPGGLAPEPSGRVLVGSGVTGSTLPVGATPARLVAVDPATGSTAVRASGLSGANGVARGPDGTVYVSSAVASGIDRIRPDGHVDHGWYRATPANGLAVSPDGKTLYANVSLGDTRIIAIDTRTAVGRTYFRPPAGLGWVFFDDLDIDRAGRLYLPTYLGGQVWRIDRNRTACVLATGLLFSAGITVGADGSGFSARSVYATTHAGRVVEIPGAVPRN